MTSGPSSTSVWGTAGIVDDLAERWNAGLSCGQIASYLCRKYDLSISRNSVIGKVVRSRQKGDKRFVRIENHASVKSGLGIGRASAPKSYIPFPEDDANDLAILAAVERGETDRELKFLFGRNGAHVRERAALILSELEESEREGV